MVADYHAIPFKVVDDVLWAYTIGVATFRHGEGKKHHPWVLGEGGVLESSGANTSLGVIHTSVNVIFKTTHHRVKVFIEYKGHNGVLNHSDTTCDEFFVELEEFEVN